MIPVIPVHRHIPVAKKTVVNELEYESHESESVLTCLFALGPKIPDKLPIGKPWSYVCELPAAIDVYVFFTNEGYHDHTLHSCE